MQVFPPRISHLWGGGAKTIEFWPHRSRKARKFPGSLKQSHMLDGHEAGGHPYGSHVSSLGQEKNMVVELELILMSDLIFQDNLCSGDTSAPYFDMI